MPSFCRYVSVSMQTSIPRRRALYTNTFTGAGYSGKLPYAFSASAPRSRTNASTARKAPSDGIRDSARGTWRRCSSYESGWAWGWVAQGCGQDSGVPDGHQEDPALKEVLKPSFGWTGYLPALVVLHCTTAGPRQQLMLGAGPVVDNCVGRSPEKSRHQAGSTLAALVSYPLRVRYEVGA